MSTTLPASAASPSAPSGALAAAHPRLLAAARVALVANVGIVLTGGLVRITGSGLGCPDWPRCDGESFVPTAGVSDGWHAAIEFGNRLLTFAVLATALGVLWELRRARHARPVPAVVTRLAWMLPIGVVVQALIGGVTVLTGLHWWTVSVHFMASMVLIGVAVVLVDLVRTDAADPSAVAPASRGIGRAATAVTGVAFLVLLLGTFVTAAGPHGGDATTPRLGIDLRVLAIAHADGVWLLLGLTVATLLVARHAAEARTARALTVLLAISVAQGGVGYLQYALGIPEGLVSLHLLGATLVWIAAMRVLVAARRPLVGRLATGSGAGAGAPAGARTGASPA
jgi:cytochrome c oxidase assembly protein subunit 15